MPAGHPRALGRAPGVPHRPRRQARADPRWADRRGPPRQLRRRDRPPRVSRRRSAPSGQRDQRADPARRASGHARDRLPRTARQAPRRLLRPRRAPRRDRQLPGSRGHPPRHPGPEAPGPHVSRARADLGRAAPAAASRRRPRGPAPLRGSRAPQRPHVHRLRSRRRGRADGAVRRLHRRHPARRVPAPRTGPRRSPTASRSSRASAARSPTAIAVASPTAACRRRRSWSAAARAARPRPGCSTSSSAAPMASSPPATARTSATSRSRCTRRPSCARASPARPVHRSVQPGRHRLPRLHRPGSGTRPWPTSRRAWPPTTTSIRARSATPCPGRSSS
jgi:hypothetical protein